MRTLLLCLVPCVVACGDQRGEREPITVFAAASLARPLSAISDTLHERDGIVVQRELGGSLEHARKLTDLSRVPDVLVLADDEVFASLLPSHIDWYVRFATSRVVIAYQPGSRHAGEITADNWWRVVTRPNVTIGRADSLTAPVGRHALTVLQRAEPYYREPGLTERLMANAGVRHVRPNATELAALLEAGEVDYILEYEAVARQYGFRTLALPGDLSVSAIYGMSIPRWAPNPDAALSFVTLVLSDAGKQLLRDAHLSVLRVPVAIGTNVPSEITDLVRTVTVAAADR